MDKRLPTRFDELVGRLKNRRTVAVAMVVGVSVISVGAFSDGVRKLVRIAIVFADQSLRVAARDETVPTIAPSDVPGDFSSLGSLTEDQLRREIGNALRAGDPDRAIELVEHLKEHDGRTDEAMRIFGYLIKNGDLNRAQNVVPKLRPSDQRAAEQRLALEVLKQTTRR